MYVTTPLGCCAQTISAKNIPACQQPYCFGQPASSVCPAATRLSRSLSSTSLSRLHLSLDHCSTNAVHESPHILPVPHPGARPLTEWLWTVTFGGALDGVQPLLINLQIHTHSHEHEHGHGASANTVGIGSWELQLHVTVQSALCETRLSLHAARRNAVLLLEGSDAGACKGAPAAAQLKRAQHITCRLLACTDACCLSAAAAVQHQTLTVTLYVMQQHNR